VLWLVLVATVVIAGLGLTGIRSSPHWVTYPRLRAGECLAGQDLRILGTGKPWPYRVLSVPCTERHLAEVIFAARKWPRAARAYPGNTSIREDAYADCAEQFARYVRPELDPLFSFADIAPDQAAWQSGDRLVTCVAYKPASAAGAVAVSYSIRKGGA
jgi:hypothetical protein